MKCKSQIKDNALVIQENFPILFDLNVITVIEICSEHVKCQKIFLVLKIYVFEMYKPPNTKKSKVCLSLDIWCTYSKFNALLV